MLHCQHAHYLVLVNEAVRAVRDGPGALSLNGEVIDTTHNSEEARLAPVLSPAVLNAPVALLYPSFLTQFYTEPHYGDRMCEGFQSGNILPKLIGSVRPEFPVIALFSL